MFAGSRSANDLMLYTVDDESIFCGFDFTGETSVGGVIFQHMRVGFCIHEVVDSDHFKFVWMSFKYGLQGLASNATNPLMPMRVTMFRCSPFVCQ